MPHRQAPQAVEIRLMSSHTTEPTETDGDEPDPGEPASTSLMLPWAAPSFLAVKGIAHEPTAMAAMKPEARDALLAAIASARRWL